MSQEVRASEKSLEKKLSHSLLKLNIKAKIFHMNKKAKSKQIKSYESS